MQRIDALIVGVLLLAAAGSAIAVVTYEDDRLGEFAIEWNVRSTEVDGEPVSHTGAGEVETTLEIGQPNITSIVFEVTVSGGPARVQPTAILVEVVSPRNDSTAAESELPTGPTASVEVPVEVELASVPDATTVTGPSLDAARVALNSTLSSSLGVGTWTIRVSFAPSAPGPLGGQEAHSVTVVANVEHYEAAVNVLGPEVGR